ncbi:MAG: M20 family metallopeptidase [Clostridiales bacterium]|nr:M20 family metallopeptidase [Clostridiales bacterium]
MNIERTARELSPMIIAWRRDLHQIPEPGLFCPRTAAYIRGELDKMGIPWQTYENHSGITALIGKKEGTVIGLRADMDALPVREENQTEYASVNGNMHACGHDAHVAILLGAAKILKEHECELNGQVKLIFQPDEEELEGAKTMLADGVLENPKVDYMLALHVGGIAGAGGEKGTLFWKTGALFASSDNFRIVIQGKSGHASTPFLAINPISVAVQLIENLQGLVSREVTYNVPSVLTVTGITAGNGAYNIIPETAEVVGGVRTQDPEARQYLLKRMKEVMDACAAEFGVSAEIEFPNGCPPVINDAKVTEYLVNAARKILPEDRIEELKFSTMGGEDVSYFFTQVPGCYALLFNACPSDDGVQYPHHNGRFSIDDSVLYLGTAIFVQTVLDQIGSC